MPKLGMEDYRKKQVIAAATNCIVDRGIANLSMKQIAEEAGVSTGIIYHYFQNKEDVLLQVLKESFSRSHEKVIDTVEVLEDPLEMLANHLENINAVPRDNPDFYMVLLNYLGHAKYHHEIREIVSRFFRNLKRYVQDYMGPDENHRNLPIMVYALGMGLGIMWTIDDSIFDAKEMEQSLKTLFLGYVKGDKEGLK